MSELTEARVREIVREEVNAIAVSQAEMARTQLAAGIARLGRHKTPAQGEVVPGRRDSDGRVTADTDTVQ